MNENTRFIQIHSLTSYSAVLLNRDDVGFAKRIPFGGKPRIRISSQCLKRHWRTFEGDHDFASLGVDASIRSRHSFEEMVYQPLIDDGLPLDIAHFVTDSLMAIVLGKSEKAKKSETGSLQTSQVTILGRPELEFILSHARIIAGLPEIVPCINALKDLPEEEEEQKKALEKIQKDVKALVEDNFSKDEKRNMQALLHAAGLDAALFGRMVTSDVLSRCDAAIHAAHAITVSAEESEIDFFSVVDDLQKNGGSGHINSTELISGIFYGYVVVDVPLLISNLTGCHRDDWLKADHSMGAQLVRNIIHLIATVTPGAKLGSTCPYSRSHMIMVELDKTQPRTLVNAFLQPVKNYPDLLVNTYQSLVNHVNDLDEMYGPTRYRQLKAIGQGSKELQSIVPSSKVTIKSLDDLAVWASSQK